MAEGADANASKAHLVDIARRLGVTGFSRMRKDDLVEAIRKANARDRPRPLTVAEMVSERPADLGEHCFASPAPGYSPP